jgi:hypothetical protein
MYPGVKIMLAGFALVLFGAGGLCWRYMVLPADTSAGPYDVSWTHLGRGGRSSQIRVGDFLCEMGLAIGVGFLLISARHINEFGIEAE